MNSGPIEDSMHISDARFLVLLVLACLQRLLDYIKPDFVHIMQSGEIVKTGDMSLVDQLEAGGYATLGSESD